MPDLSHTTNTKFAMQSIHTLSLVALAVGICLSTGRADLIHRYSFNETAGTTVNDSVGNAHGTLKGQGAFFDGAGRLFLPGGGISTDPAESIAGYVDLPNGLISGLPRLTIEAWVTWEGSGPWQRIFDFGTSAGGEDIANGQGNYLFLSPQGPAALRFAVRDPATGTEPTQLTALAALTVGEPVAITVTYDPAANTARLYSNAVLVASGPAAVALNAINDVNNWLGRSQWPDAMFQGVFNEFRIWRGVLSADQVAANYAAGPDQLPEPTQPPTLAISRTGDNVVLSWPANATGFVLEVTPSLAPPITWTSVNTDGAVEEGGLKKLTLPLEAGPRFYRMRK